MILDEYVNVPVHNTTRRYYSQLGYNTTHKIGTLIQVKVSDLPKKSNVKVNIRCNTCDKEFLAKYQQITEGGQNCWECGRKASGNSLRLHHDTEYKCEICEIQFVKNARWLIRRKKESNNTQILCYECDRKRIGFLCEHNLPRLRGKKHPNFNPTKTDYMMYMSKVRTITEKNYNNHIDEINPNRHQRTLCGVDGGYQLDHILSIKNGFEQGILPSIIAAKENLQMLPWKDNRTKW